MGLGQGLLISNQKKEPSGAPFAPGSAENGCSINGAGRVVLGNDPAGAPGAAAFLSDREIYADTFFLRIMTDAGFNPEGSGNIFLDSTVATVWGVNFNTPKLGVEGITMTKKATRNFEYDVNVDGQRDNWGNFQGDIPLP